MSFFYHNAEGRKMRKRYVFVLTAIILVLTACATIPADPMQAIIDRNPTAADAEKMSSACLNSQMRDAQYLKAVAASPLALVDIDNAIDEAAARYNVSPQADKDFVRAARAGHAKAMTAAYFGMVAECDKWVKRQSSVRQTAV
jgi:uncharacterized lipoprotein YajG